MELSGDRRLPQLEYLGDATQFAARLHAMVPDSPLFENLNLAEIRLMSHFMQVYRAQAGQEVIREGDSGDFLMFVIEGRIEVFRQDRAGSPRLIAVVEAGKTLGEMSMIDGEPRFATCVADGASLIGVLTRESLARIILEQPILGAKILMELVLMLSQRLRQTSSRLLAALENERGPAGVADGGTGFV
ncbi:MAG: cyclic nucleotide-binding domain-containing protein [Burkholderiales bacterium]|nr:cyclic nucleotide-binding domain-containing protein [Burkholderiales bacterium]